MISAATRFQQWVQAETNLKDHLQFLTLRAEGNVVELGVRAGIATSALLYGVERNGGHLWSIDRNEKCSETFRDHPDWTFLHLNSIDIKQALAAGAPSEIDFLFLNTQQSFEQVSSELRIWWPLMKPAGLAIVHRLDEQSAQAATEEFSKSHGLKFHLRAGNPPMGLVFSPDRKEI